MIALRDGRGAHGDFLGRRARAVLEADGKGADGDLWDADAKARVSWRGAHGDPWGFPVPGPGITVRGVARDGKRARTTLRTGSVPSAASAEFRCLLGVRALPGSNPPSGWGAPTRRTDGAATG
ncbi:hypothetical protein GCM10009677_12780 [Sphaerisporangium rubeum]